MSKYNARPVVADGIRFDSQAEWRRYNELVLLQKADAIQGLKVHPRYEIIPGCMLNGRKLRAVAYEGDFYYVENGAPVVEDVKGFETPAFKIKARLFRDKYPNIELRIIPAR